ncbi:MAG: hypothetical protein V8S34_09120 [Lawsonibacter sp.]
MTAAGGPAVGTVLLSGLLHDAVGVTGEASAAIALSDYNALLARQGREPASLAPSDVRELNTTEDGLATGNLGVTCALVETRTESAVRSGPPTTPGTRRGPRGSAAPVQARTGLIHSDQQPADDLPET